MPKIDKTNVEIELSHWQTERCMATAINNYSKLGETLQTVESGIKEKTKLVLGTLVL